MPGPVTLTEPLPESVQWPGPPRGPRRGRRSGAALAAHARPAMTASSSMPVSTSVAAAGASAGCAAEWRSCCCLTRHDFEIQSSSSSGPWPGSSQFGLARYYENDSDGDSRPASLTPRDGALASMTNDSSTRLPPSQSSPAGVALADRARLCHLGPLIDHSQARSAPALAREYWVRGLNCCPSHQQIHGQESMRKLHDFWPTCSREYGT